MATDHEESVRAALFGHLTALTTTPATEIAWPNISFDPATYPYLRVNVIPTRPGMMTEDGTRKPHRGILQVDVVTKRGGGYPSSLVDQLCQHFRQGVQIFGSDGRFVHITEPPYPTAPFDDETETIVPVQVRYTSSSTVSSS
ncbi:phage tail terminator-like protein [uncultured Hyphomonas sp.]|uniref:phage tail terminator-like protein n=1 Tax=uncultured Hyphomonas sp. TaxID=225298 RepID=UPI000C658689|nr:hypothetical protein [Hyphomonadaceae bacterium]MBA30091.1 hypothetical protein [Hyphomonadaceae bacterium]|tara:strand:- start:15264 stop:15689 length:426 start_codon:yes stop_codon:yes gene_type:complete